MSSLQRNGESGTIKDISRKKLQLSDSATLMLVPNAFVPQALQRQTESQVDAIIAQLDEIKCEREELERRAQKEIDDIEMEHPGQNLEQPSARTSKLRRIWRKMDALYERGDALEQVYFVYKLAVSGLRWISPSELANIPEEEAMAVIEVLYGKAAYIEGYEQYATHDVRVVLQCLKSSTGKVCLLDGKA